MPGDHLWLGPEWQDFCVQLLRLRYLGHELHEVPDRHQGDLGIEAFTQDGCAFQCYAAEEPLAVEDLYGKQRDKLTKDLSKLRDNSGRFVELLGEVVLDRYVFMVPRHDSRKLVAHAQAKALEVISWDLPFIADSFFITVETADSYERERQLLASVPLADLLPSESTEPPDRSLLADAREKLTSAGMAGATLDRVLEALEQQYVAGENSLQALRDRYPTHWKAIANVRSAKESRLVLQYPPESSVPSSLMSSIAGDLSEEIQQVAPPIGKSVADLIAWASVADWTMRCPLRFGDDVA